MNWFQKRLSDIHNKIRENSLSPDSSDLLGFVRTVSSYFSDSGKEAVYPQWFFSARMGQPRQVNITEIRSLAKSPWVQMVLNTIKRELKTIPWDVVPEEEDDETDYSEKIKLVKNFLNNLNNNCDDITDITSETVTDIGEIDAGVWNKIYSIDSYDVGEIPVYDMYGKTIGTEQGLILKPFGQRTLKQIKTVDGGSMLKQVDIHKNLLRYYQYSFKHPRVNPTPFEPDEIEYFSNNPRPYNIYGFSPLQSVQQVIELLIQGTRYNKDLYMNNAIPDIIATLPKLPADDLKKLKRLWNNEYKGKPHQVGFINFPIESFEKLSTTNRDLEWLEGQRWYFRIVFAAFGVSPTEAGFFENANKSNDEGQSRVTVRSAIKPYLSLFEKRITRKIITEILQEENPGIKFKYLPKNHEEEMIEFTQEMQKIQMGVITINEYRTSVGQDPVPWGNVPLNQGMGQPSNTSTDDTSDENNDESNSKLLNQEFKKKFERFLGNGGTTA